MYNNIMNYRTEYPRSVGVTHESVFIPRFMYLRCCHIVIVAMGPRMRQQTRTPLGYPYTGITFVLL